MSDLINIFKMTAGEHMKKNHIYYRRKKFAVDEVVCEHNHFREFHRLHRSMKFLRPLMLVINILIVYLLFRWVGLKVIGIIIIILLLFMEIIQFFFFSRLEKKVIKPINQLQYGLAEISRGNFNVSIDTEERNEFGQLIHAFNEMAYKLQESEKTNLEYEENRKNLIASISHDLKTPITSIQGYLEMILDNEQLQPEKMQQYLKIIDNNTRYMNRLIDDLFLFSRLDIEKVDFHFEITPICAYMRDLMDEIRFELEELQVGFSYQDKMDKECPVNIDGKRVYQAIRNIIGNAVKYGPASGLNVDVELNRQDEWICLAMTDNGPGIASEKLPYIFERFYRVDNERSKDFISTGLGLAIARELVEAQGGKIMVSSAEESGSCFTIFFPFSGE